jgi:hypothetical protein
MTKTTKHSSKLKGSKEEKADKVEDIHGYTLRA